MWKEDWKDMSDQQKKAKAKSQFDAILKKKLGNPKKYDSPIKEWGDTGPLSTQDVRQHGRRDWAKSKEAERKDSDRLAKQQADREKKYQKAKKEEAEMVDAVVRELSNQK